MIRDAHLARPTIEKKFNESLDRILINVLACGFQEGIK
jgi:hypothetical protein